MNQVTKPIEFPQAQFLDKAGDMLVGMQRHVPMAQTVRKTVEVPPLPFINKVVDTPVVAQRQISMVRTIQKTTEIPQLQCDDQVVDVPAEVAVQAPHVHVVAETAETPRLPLVSQIPQAQIVEKTVEEPQSQIVEKTAETPEIQMVRGTETSESLGIARTRQMAHAETVEAVVIEAPPPTESARPMFVTTPVLETPPVVAEYVQLAPGAEYVALAPAVAYGHAAADPVTTVAPTVFPIATVPVSMRRPYPASQVMTQEVLVPVAVPKTLDSPRAQLIDKVLNIPVMAQTQVPSAQRVQKIVEMPVVQFSDGHVDMPVITQRQVPMIPNVQKVVEVPQIQYIDKIVDAPVVARSEDVSVGTQTVSRKRKLSMETESADGTSDEEHGLVQEGECESKVDETREKHAGGEDLDLLPVAPNMEAGGSHLQATAEEERIVDWTQDLREIRRMVEFLVRRERKLDVKADVAVRRLARLEKEHSQQEDEECEASLPDALADRTKVVKLVVDKWFVDKGFGFGRVPTGEVIFIHASVVRGAEVLTIGTDAWVQVVHDDARAQGGYRACKAWGRAAWKEERDKERASKVAEQVRRAAALTAELAAQSEKEVSEVCSHPPGLHDEPAKTSSVTSPVTISPFPLVASSSFAASDSSLPAGTGFSNHTGGFRGVQPRTATRAQEVATMLDETLGFYVKATGKGESLMRGQFSRMKLESLRKERDRWRIRAEAKQRVEDKKEEAWELFQRQPGWGPKGRKDFEREYEQKVTTKRFSPFDLGPPDADEKSLQEWVDKLLVKALAEDRKKEATECQKMRQEDANSRWRQSWEKLREINFAVQLTDQ